MSDIKEFEQKNKFDFKNRDLLKLALTHSSYCSQNQLGHSNQRLEFLGDAVLELCTSEFLYENYPDLNEGEMSLMRARVVCENALYIIAQEINLGEYLLLGKGEESSGGRNKASVLSDAFEALIGALYIDGGLENAKQFVYKFLPKQIQETANTSSKDFKTLLQEKLQEKGSCQIKYIIIKESGPDHNKEFVSEVLYNGKKLGCGNGKSKKIAEQMAAENALLKVKDK